MSIPYENSQLAENTTAHSAPYAPELSIIVPTFCERGNIEPLIAEIKDALAGVAWEVVFVDDDSSDGTAEHIRAIAQHMPAVRCVQRIGRRGLSAACIEGLLSVSAPVVAVMDADLQHDTSKLADMLSAIRAGAEIAIASRVVEGGSFGEMSERRQIASTLSSRLARTLLKVEISDPMSGFFMLRRSLFMEVAHRLSGLGFKILLDIIASAPRRVSVVEIPYRFRERHTGESKLDSAVVLDYALLLADKTVGAFLPVRFLFFSMIGGLGVVVHFIVLTTLFRGLQYSFDVSQATAAFVAMIFNFILNNRLTFRDHRLKGARLLRGLLSFVAVSSVGLVGNVGVAHFLFSSHDVFWTLSALAGVCISAIWNYSVSKSLTWGVGKF